MGLGDRDRSGAGLRRGRPGGDHRLILTELIINAQKYAYDGAPGPLRIGLTEADDSLRLVVSDDGKGGHKAGKGFGSMMIGSLVAQLGGQIDYRDQKPGLEVALRTRIEAPA